MKQKSQISNLKSQIFGFTLIELLVVISIIGILAGLGTARYLVAQKHARDTERKSDLNQYRVALENYASAYNSLYPKVSGDITGLCDTGGFASTYLSGPCLDDVFASKGTHYIYNSTDGIDYVLAATLESNNNYYVVCSNGRSGEASSLNGSTCPL
ncbi:MAG TPA: type II secretion system protein [Clostridia bacterium]|nr:type II secretion system protein [Clostridia bacterium]